AAADITKLAITTFAFEAVRVAQLLEDRGVAIDLCQGLMAHIARDYRKEAAGIHVPVMGDKDEAVAVIDAFGRAADPVGLLGAGLRGEAKTPPGGRGRRLRNRRRRTRAPFRGASLQHHTAIVLGRGGTNIKGGALAEVIKPLEIRLKFLGGDEVFGPA